MKTVFITGAGKGIGKALKEKYLAEGWFVVAAYLKTEPDAHENLLAIKLDLTSEESISGAISDFEKTGKKIDVLINNAGVLLDVEDTDVVIQKLRDTLEVNLLGNINFTEQALPLIADGGHIINISSTAGSLDLTDDPVSHAPGLYPAYKISKAALNMYTRTLALREDIKKRGITVSSVHPGWVRTDMGGQDADMSPEEAAGYIYKFSESHPETGYFWFKGEKLAW